MNRATIPAALCGRIQPVMTLEQVQRRIAFERALRPERKPVTREQFEQLVYDRVASNTAMDRAAVVRALRASYRIEDAA